MAYFIMDSIRAAYDEEGPKNVVVIQVDSSSDLPNPVPEDWAPGSAAWDTSTGDIYGLNSEKRWENQGSGGTIPMLIEKTITENGTYNASDDGADGYSSVTVEVPSSGGETFNFSVTLNIEMTGEEEIPTTLVSDKTYSEIVSAFNNGDKLVPTVTANTIAGGQTSTTTLTVALCTVDEGVIWLCGYGHGTGLISITWVENATTGVLRISQASNIVIES